MAAILGNILGIIILIFGIVFVVGMICYALNFDFDAPIFRIDITFLDKSKKKEEN